MFCAIMDSRFAAPWKLLCNRGSRSKFSGGQLILTLYLLIYFASSFPIRTNRRPNPELGPFFEGDIVDYPSGRNGIPGENWRWEEGHVQFYVSDDYSFQEMYLIYFAILEITVHTCITVHELLKSDHSDLFVDHLYYTRNESYCASRVGHRNFLQLVWLGPPCFQFGYGIPLHETLHALGFYHEQSRQDRDEYVTINYSNIWPKEKGNFDILPSVTFGVPYDYGSIMHYGAYDFAMNPIVKTIVVKQPGAEIGQRVQMSPSDIDKVNLMYEEECNAKSASKAFQTYLSQKYG